MNPFPEMKDFSVLESSVTNITSESPIGVFDSGLGGLSVVRELVKELPHERILYFADTAHVPYGGRPLEQVRSFAISICDFLIGQGAKMVVMACNISSATALETARKKYPQIPILGMIFPGAKTAVDASSNSHIGVLATQGTVLSQAYPHEIQKLKPSVEVVQQACPKFVPLIESGNITGTEAHKAAEEYTRVFREQDIHTIILGCTHYPFMAPVIRELMPEATLVDPAFEAAQQARRILSERNLLKSDGPALHNQFYTSGSVSQFQEMGSGLLGQQINNVKHQTLSEINN